MKLKIPKNADFIADAGAVVGVSVSAPKLVSFCQSYEELPPPVGHVVRQVSPVRQIVVAERAVVEAYGKVEATVVEVEVKYVATA